MLSAALTCSSYDAFGILAFAFFNASPAIFIASRPPFPNFLEANTTNFLN